MPQKMVGSVRKARPLTKALTKFLLCDNVNRDEQYELKDVTCEQAVSSECMRIRVK